jgi:hypothetical protein
MIWMRDGLNAVGSGYKWQDMLNYSNLYVYDHGRAYDKFLKGE